jgi:hypothetical protein
MNQFQDQFDAKDRLASSLKRDRETAYAVAQYQRSHKDDFTARLRFGVFALNGASVVALLSALPNAAIAKSYGLDGRTVVLAILCFSVGAAVSGLSLVLHQAHLERVSGEAVARARTLDSAVNVSGAKLGSSEYAQLGEIMTTANRHEQATYAVSPFSRAAIWMQSLGGGLWLGGIAVVLKSAIQAALH